MPGRLMAGLLLLILGVVFLLEQLAGETGHRIHGLFVMWWPLLLVLLALNWLCRRQSRPWGAFLLLLFGVLLQLEHLQLLRRDIWPSFWSVLLIIIGIRLLLPRHRFACNTSSAHTDRIDDTVTFASIHRQDDATCFVGGVIEASFSKYELDLQDAILAASGAELELRSNFSSIVVRVPATWTVITTGLPNFGSCVNKSRQTDATIAGTPIVRVTCTGNFGSIEITN